MDEFTFIVAVAKDDGAVNGCPGFALDAERSSHRMGSAHLCGGVVAGVARGGVVAGVARGGAVAGVARGGVVAGVARGGAVAGVARGGAVDHESHN